MSDLKNKDYFPHPSNLRNDRRMKRVMKDLPGGVGYGAVVITMERLRCEENYSYPLSDLDLLADEFDISLPILQTIVSKYGFFELKKSDSEEIIISPLLNTLMQPYQARKEQAQIAGKISATKRKIKQEKQLQELSQLSSTELPFNVSDTDKIILDKTRQEYTIPDNNISLHNQNYANFSSFKTFLINNYKNKIVCYSPPGYEKHVTVSITSLGYLHNDFAKKDLETDDAKKVWQYLFENQHLLVVNQKN